MSQKLKYKSPQFENAGNETSKVSPAAAKVQEKLIIECYLSGLTDVFEISKATSTSPSLVRAIISKCALREKANAVQSQVAEVLIRDKVPLLSEVVNLSLEATRIYMQSLVEDRERIKNLTTTEVKDISSIGKNWNEMLRLEKGEPTSRVKVQHSLEETGQLLQKLKQMDKIFDYPDTSIEVLPDGRLEIHDDLEGSGDSDESL